VTGYSLLGLYTYFSSPYYRTSSVHVPPLVCIPIQSLKPCVTFRNLLIFYEGVLLAPLPNRKIEGQPLSTVCACLCNICIRSYYTHISRGRVLIPNLRAHHAALTRPSQHVTDKGNWNTEFVYFRNTDRNLEMCFVVVNCQTDNKHVLNVYILHGLRTSKSLSRAGVAIGVTWITEVRNAHKVTGRKLCTNWFVKQ
jgi:hypothetical protein